MTEVSREIAVLVWIVAAGLVATVVAIVALIVRGQGVPPLGDPWPEHSGPSKQKRDGPARPARFLFRPAFHGRKA